MRKRRRIRPKPSISLQALIDRDGLHCCWCGQLCDLNANRDTDLYPTREHVVRLADGGSNDPSNLTIACRKCNNSRGTLQGKPTPSWKHEHPKGWPENQPPKRSKEMCDKPNGYIPPRKMRDIKARVARALHEREP